MPPKNIISVTRNTHMPRVPASRVAPYSQNGAAALGGFQRVRLLRNSQPTSASLLALQLSVLKLFSELPDNLHLFRWSELVSFPRNNRRCFKILRWRRRLRPPFETRQVPGVSFGMFSIPHRPDKIDCRYQHPETEDRRSSSRQNIEDLKLRRIGMIPSRHAHVAGHKLRQEGQVEANENNQGAKSPPTLRVHTSRYLGPPVM